MTPLFQRCLVIDFETRWSSKPTTWSPEPYTLSKLTTEAYIRSPLFKAQGCCLKEYGSPEPAVWYTHADLPDVFASVDWSTTAVLAQNSMFDVGILSMIYGHKPAFILDSLSMARAVRGVKAGNSLAKLAAAFNLPPKGHATHSTDGLWELPPHVEEELAEYCKHDVYLCEQVFTKLLLGVDEFGNMHGQFPTKELRLIDMTLRMFTEPELVLDVEMLTKAAVEEEAKLAGALRRAGVSEEALASNQQFAEILKQYGIEPPMKKSKTTHKPALALAKNDAHFQALLNGDNEEVALLCEARLKVKSTLERTRAHRFIDIAGRGALPVPLLYYGAETGRWSATGSINLQNMKRGSFLRRSISAPPGYMLCVGDLSQIEPRVLAWLSGYEELLDIFRAGQDPYAAFAAPMFGVPGMTKESHPLLRQSGKSALLGAGYQLGWASFAAQLLVGFLGAPPVRYTKADARQLGVQMEDVEKFLDNPDYIKRMMEIAHTCTEEELLIHCLASKAIIDKYRNTAQPVVDFWELLQELIPRSLIGGEEYAHKCLLFRKEEIVLANGMSLKYPNLRVEKEIDEETGRSTGRSQYVYGDGKKLYAGRVCNNVTQGTARIIMSDGLLRSQKRYPVKGSAHDEGIFLLPESDKDVVAPWIKAQMTKEPVWMPGIPLDADVNVGVRYGDIK